MVSNTNVRLDRDHAQDDVIGTSLDLTGVLAAKMKITLSLISGSDDHIKEFMKRVDDDVSRMGSTTMPDSLSTLVQVLKSTKAIMDRFSQVVHLSSLNLIVAN
jgi:hypothetical protein